MTESALGKYIGRVAVQPSVYSDKSSIYLKGVSGENRIEYETKDGRIIELDEGLLNAKIEDLEWLDFESMRASLSIIFDNILNDYKELLTELGYNPTSFQ
jgi:hypothetical protein